MTVKRVALILLYPLLPLLLIGCINTVYQLVIGSGKASPDAIANYAILVPAVIIVVVAKAFRRGIRLHRSAHEPTKRHKSVMKE